MKKFSWCWLLIILSCKCYADVPQKIINNYHQIIKLIKENKPQQLAKYVSYPLKRQNPLPDIASKAWFVKYYDTLFDTAFRRKLSAYNDSVIFERNGQYGLVGGNFSGDIWLDGNGKIARVNYCSAKEQDLIKQITLNQKKQIYPSVNDWKKNIYVAGSKKLLIRVDDTSKGFRYVAWENGTPTSDRPDLILYNGKQEQQGTMGGWTYTFKNKNWTYVVDDVQLCDAAKNCGLFLKLYKKDKLIKTFALKEKKN